MIARWTRRTIRNKVDSKQVSFDDLYELNDWRGVVRTPLLSGSISQERGNSSHSLSLVFSSDSEDITSTFASVCEAASSRRSIISLSSTS